MVGSQKKPRWLIAIIIAAHVFGFYQMLRHGWLPRIGSMQGKAMDVTSFDIQPPSPTTHALPSPRMFVPAPLRADEIGVPGIDLGPAVAHNRLAPQSGVPSSQATVTASERRNLPTNNAAAGTNGDAEGIPTLAAGLVRYLVQPRGIYPPGSANANEAGKAKVKIEFNEDGRAVNATLLASTGFPRLDQAALEGAMHAVLAPLPGQKRRVLVNQDILFMVY